MYPVKRKSNQLRNWIIINVENIIKEPINK